MTLWLDPGVVLGNTFEKDVEYARGEGLYSPKSSGPIELSLQPASLQFLKRYFAVSVASQNETLCYPSYFLLNTRNETILQKVVLPFYQCAFTKKCILPTISTLSRHRNDQAILSLLVKSVSIPHTASNLSNRRPSSKWVKNTDFRDICLIVC